MTTRRVSNRQQLRSVADWRQLHAAGDRVLIVYDDEGSALAVNVLTGRWMPMSRTMGFIWEHLDAGLDLQRAVEAVARRWELPLSRLRREVEAQLPKLLRWRVLVGGYRGPTRRLRELAPTAASPSRRIVVAESERASSLSFRIAAWLAFYTVIALRLRRPPTAWIAMTYRSVLTTCGAPVGQRRDVAASDGERPTILPFWLLLRILTAICRLRRQRPTLAASKRAVATTRHVARWHPGWADCFEIITAAVLLEAICGRAPTWCLGGIPGRPLRHTFLVADGVAVDHADQDTRGQLVRVVVAINEPRQPSPGTSSHDNHPS
jgi:hypothetical protein